MRRRLVTLALLVVAPLVCLDAAAAPQATGGSAPPAVSGPGQVSGRVTAADSGGPLRRATVRLQPIDAVLGIVTPTSPDALALTTVTDAEGRFEFADLAAGNYALSVARSGFVQADGRRVIKVGNAEKVRADIVMHRAPAISGRVVDEYGDPVDNVAVMAIPARRTSSPQRPLGAGRASTNDLGQYRLYGLQPGTYYVSATQPPTMGPAGEVRGGSGYAATYAPGTANVAEAQTVTVAAGQDATTVDISLVSVRTARVGGIALDSQGRPAVGGSVSIAEINTSFSAFTQSRTSLAPDGTFSSWDLPPGDYMITVQVRPPAPRPVEVGRARVTVAGTDITGLAIQARVGATLGGQVTFAGASPPPPLRGIEVSASPADPTELPMLGRADPQVVKDDGRFTLTGLFGSQLLAVSNVPKGWSVKAIYVNSRDVSDTPLAFDGREAIASAQVVLSDAITRVTGRVTDESGEAVANVRVAVFPVDQARWYVKRRRADAPATNGTFQIEGLPAGDYLAVALDATIMQMLLRAAADTSDALEQIRKWATPFTLGEGEARELSLKLSRLTDR